LKDQGVIFTDLLTAYQQYPDLVEKVLGKVIDFQEDKFGALAAAMSRNGIFLYVPSKLRLRLHYTVCIGHPVKN